MLRAAGQGADMVSQVAATAAEVVRNRRDPSVVAERRRVAARRRCSAWSVASVALAALATYGAVTAFSGGADAADIAALVLAVGLLVWCVLGAVRAAMDLRVRTRIVRRLPPPQPRRSPVASMIRPQIDRLSAYSDSLRELIGMVGVLPLGTVGSLGPVRSGNYGAVSSGSVSPSRSVSAGRSSPRAGRGRDEPSDSTIRALRDDTLAAADRAEAALRARAAELSALVKAARAAGARRAAAAQTAPLVAEITAGVDAYGRLVAATGQAVAASRQLAGSVPGVDQLAEVTDRLTALAAGMRELSDPAAGPRPD